MILLRARIFSFFFTILLDSFPDRFYVFFRHAGALVPAWGRDSLVQSVFPSNERSRTGFRSYPRPVSMIARRNRRIGPARIPRRWQAPRQLPASGVRAVPRPSIGASAPIEGVQRALRCQISLPSGPESAGQSPRQRSGEFVSRREWPGELHHAVDPILGYAEKAPCS
jgi:hypothetical protein